MGGHLIEADTPVTLHVLPAVDLQVPVGVDRDQDGANVGLGGGEGQKFLPEAPEPLPASALHLCPPLGPHIDEVLPEASPQVLDEGGLAGEVLQQHEILYPHPVSGGQCALHGHPHPVTAQGLQGWAMGEGQR